MLLLLMVLRVLLHWIDLKSRLSLLLLLGKLVMAGVT
jgi:hypothetical protein